MDMQVQHYTPAERQGPSEGCEAGGTPLWSNAGHTPYSLTSCSTAGQCPIRSLSFEAGSPEPTAGMVQSSMEPTEGLLALRDWL